MSVVSLNSNSAAQAAERRLALSERAVRRSYERLSSGLRIVHASDDAAGLSIGASLNADARIFHQAVRNVGDAIGYLNIAEGAAGELATVLVRMRELSTQSSNGTLGSTQRGALEDEFVALTDEYNRIIEATAVNGRKLFSSDDTELAVQVGYGPHATLTAVLGETVTQTSIAPDGTFQAGANQSAGLNPRSTAAADLNGDGVTDLISGDYGGDTISVFISNGDGTFQARQTFATGNGPTHVEAADFDGDGNIDLATTDLFDTTISIFRGNGDGTFQPRQIIPAAPGSNVYQLDSGDFDGNGTIDLVVSDGNLGGVQVLLGNGNGTFQAPVRHGTLGETTEAVTIGDVNGDGNADIIDGSYSTHSIGVYLGNGDGTFQARQATAAGTFPWSIAFGHFDGDGNLDVAIGDGSDENVRVYRGNGDGTFQAPQIYGPGTTVTAADLNGDDILDLATAYLSGDVVSVLTGNGDGTFTTGSSSSSGSEPYFIGQGDFNNDGATDLVTADQFGGATVYIANTSSTTTEQRIVLESLAGMSIATVTDARNAQDQIDAHLSDVNTVRGLIGSSMSRFESAASLLRVTADNVREAESRIVDADVAEEAANLTRAKILQEAGASVLGLAARLPELALRLLA